MDLTNDPRYLTLKGREKRAMEQTSPDDPIRIVAVSVANPIDWTHHFLLGARHACSQTPAH